MTLNRTQGNVLLLTLAAAGAIALAFTPPIAQPLVYHQFADQRALVGIPNALNVLSNIGFLVVGLWGMLFVAGSHNAFADPIERLPYLIFFVGVALTCFGSSYYHLAPDNNRLVWDRLPMTVGFTALYAAVLGERVSLRFAMRALPFFLLAGIASVLYWGWSENVGRGDLRPYLFVQFFPVLTIPLLLWLFPARYTHRGHLLLAVAIYGGAKVFELFDAEFLAATRFISGHSLKHLAAAGATWFVLRMLQKREPA